MFGILAGWLMEVGEDFHLSQRTLSLAISYLVTFIQRQPVERTLFQCIGQVCLWIAAYDTKFSVFSLHALRPVSDAIVRAAHLVRHSKSEDIYDVPHLIELVAVSDYAYTTQQLTEEASAQIAPKCPRVYNERFPNCTRQELNVLKVLNFVLHIVTPLDALEVRHARARACSLVPSLNMSVSLWRRRSFK